MLLSLMSSAHTTNKKSTVVSARTDVHTHTHQIRHKRRTRGRDKKYEETRVGCYPTPPKKYIAYISIFYIVYTLGNELLILFG